MLLLYFWLNCNCYLNYMVACFLGLNERQLTPLDLFSLTGTEIEEVIKKPTSGIFVVGFQLYLTRHISFGSCIIWGSECILKLV